LTTSTSPGSPILR